LPEESQYIWKNILYYQQSKKDVTLEIRMQGSTVDIKSNIGGLQEEKKEFKHGMD
jgi:hypothetical protein